MTITQKSDASPEFSLQSGDKEEGFCILKALVVCFQLCLVFWIKLQQSAHSRLALRDTLFVIYGQIKAKSNSRSDSWIVIPCRSVCARPRLSRPHWQLNMFYSIKPQAPRLLSAHCKVLLAQSEVDEAHKWTAWPQLHNPCPISLTSPQWLLYPLR